MNLANAVSSRNVHIGSMISDALIAFAGEPFALYHWLAVRAEPHGKHEIIVLLDRELPRSSVRRLIGVGDYGCSSCSISARTSTFDILELR
jgi:hypothetical protein